MLRHLSLTLICSLFSLPGLSATEFQTSAVEIDPESSYVFYSHGLIVEGDDPRPEHARWGVYDFPAVAEALSDEDYHLIATHRPAKTDPLKYAKNLTDQVNKLIDSGVPARNITLIGFSRGGFITAITSSMLENEQVNFVILAACTSGLAKRPDIRIHGKLLSIYETSDRVGSCDEVVARSGDTVTSYQEIAISTGEEHGAFYRPIPEWVEPLKSWIKQQITLR